MMFILEVEPTAKGRPRATRNGHMYTPKKTKDAEKLIAQLVKLDPACHKSPTEDPVMVEMTFYVGMPKSWSKKKREEHKGEPCLKKLDLDNLAKLTSDALNGILWEDDSQIWSLNCKKYWSETPKIMLNVL